MLDRRTRHVDRCTMEPLQAVLEHGTVFLLQHVDPNLDFQIGPNAENVSIERCVVERAQRQAVRDDRKSVGVAIRKNVRGVEKLLVPEPADRTLIAIGAQNPDAKPCWCSRVRTVRVA
jgi:hypothetical protein